MMEGWSMGCLLWIQRLTIHYSDVIMGTMASQITSLTIVYSTVYSSADQRKHQSSASLAFVRGIHRGPVNTPHKWPVTRKMFPFDDVIMIRLSSSRVMHYLVIKTVLYGDVALRFFRGWNNFLKNTTLWHRCRAHTLCLSLLFLHTLSDLRYCIITIWPFPLYTTNCKLHMF